MKTLDEMYKEITGNDALKKELGAALKEGKLEEFIKKNDISASVEDVVKYMKGLQDGAVNDDALDAVAGGGCSSYSCNMTTCCYNTYGYYMC